MSDKRISDACDGGASIGLARVDREYHDECKGCDCECHEGAPVPSEPSAAEREPDGWIAGVDVAPVKGGYGAPVYGSRALAGRDPKPVWIGNPARPADTAPDALRAATAVVEAAGFVLVPRDEFEPHPDETRLADIREVIHRLDITTPSAPATKEEK